MEIMGRKDIMSEIETIKLIVHSLETLGIKSDKIHVRFNDISIFNKLIIESNLSEKRVIIKELLDTLAEIKAGKKIERRDRTIHDLNLEIGGLSQELKRKWFAVIDQDNYRIDYAKESFGYGYRDQFDRLGKIQEVLGKFGMIIDLDLCVIRSHEYYTSMSFEVDVWGKNQKYIEIAGGGRYDRLVSNFMKSAQSHMAVPCIGFAFGVERLIEMLQIEELYPSGVTLKSKFNFDNGAGQINQDIDKVLNDISKLIQ
jgi:histidyl-tRNA synthetase